jgi:pyrroloquinoline quinone (PQQ) biosynthesis protein C
VPVSRAALRAKIDLISAPLAEALGRFFDRPSDLRHRLVAHAILIHQITRASGPLMQAALEAARVRSGDAAASGLASYLERHIEEERHHDLWLLEDLESVGVSRDHVLAAPPPSAIAAMVGAQYYWIHHHDPMALLGYMLMLECNAPKPDVLARLQHWSGLPESFFRTHRIHAELDPDHQFDLLERATSLPLAESRRKLIEQSMLHTLERMAEALADLAAREAARV